MDAFKKLDTIDIFQIKLSTQTKFNDLIFYQTGLCKKINYQFKKVILNRLCRMFKKLLVLGVNADKITDVLLLLECRKAKIHRYVRGTDCAMHSSTSSL